MCPFLATIARQAGTRGTLAEMPSVRPSSLLAAPRVPLIGRAEDVAAIGRWIDEGARVVTITGPSGIGKTRVALEIARARDEASAASVVELSDVADIAGLCDAVGRALGLGDEEGAGDPVGRIGRTLATRGEGLVVLDGFDRLAAHAEATLGRWLAADPELVLVVASRERTRLPGEVVHELGPLPEAEELFVTSAQRIRAGWAPSDADREAIAEIVRELEGVPLAIELAASRLSVMGARALLHRVRSGAPGVRDGLARALEGAWSSLDEDERRALAGASVFRGGFAIDAAEAVLTSPAGGRAVIDVVSRLRDKSLLLGREDANGEVRLDMYLSLRAFAAQKLDETPDARPEAEARHATHYATFAAELARGEEGRARLLAERENLLAVIERVAHAGTVSARAAEPALRALLALAPLLFAHGPLRAYEILVDPALAATRGSGADPALVAQVLLVRGALHRHRGAAAKGARDLVQALGIARTVANASLEARATVELAHALEDAGDLASAEDHFRRAAELHAGAGDVGEEARAHASLAALLSRVGRVDEARALLARAIAAHADDPAARAEDLRSLGELEMAAGRLAVARTVIEESLAASLAQKSTRGAALARMQLGLVEQRAGRRPAARASFEGAAASFAELGFTALAATAEGHLGVLASEEGKIAESHARLSSACAALGELALGANARLFLQHLEALASPSSAPPPPSEEALVVASAGAWFRAPRGARVGLERRRPLALLVERLAMERLERPGAPLASRALQDAAWPGEKILAAAGAHRVRVAVSTLRKLGLPIVTGPDGYALDPKTPILRA